MSINLAEFVLLVVFAACAAVCLGTIVSRLLHARREAASLRRRVICRLCLHAYEDESGKAIVPCPMCGAQNRRGRDRSLG